MRIEDGILYVSRGEIQHIGLSDVEWATVQEVRLEGPFPEGDVVIEPGKIERMDGKDG